jgi:hypothetical protein
MNDPFILIEQRRQEEADAAAFRRLSATRRRLASGLASMGFTGRQKVVGVAGFLLGVTEILINYLLIWPYRILAASLLLLTNTVEKSAILVVTVVTALTVAALAAMHLGLRLAHYFVHLFVQLRLVAEGTSNRWLANIVAANAVLRSWRQRVAKWSADVRQKIDQVWIRTKASFAAFLRYTGEAVEFYGAIGLFRATKWILNPRLRSGRPLFGRERINKAFGIVIATGGFAILLFLLTAVGVLAKFMHAHLAASFVTDTSPLAIKIAKQLLYQPLITVGLTAAKFVLLPIIAATQQTLKSTDLARGVAYAYGRRLRRHRKKKSGQIGVNAATPESSATGDTSNSLALNLRMVSLNFVGTFVAHLVEKASPNFYEGRLRYYRTRGA